MEKAEEFIIWYSENLGDTNYTIQKKLDSLPYREIQRLRTGFAYIGRYISGKIPPQNIY